MRYYELDLLGVLTAFAYSQNTTRGSVKSSVPPYGPVYQRYVDSLSVFRERMDSLYAAEDTSAVRPTVTGRRHPPRYMRLFAPMTYYPDVVRRHFSLDENDSILTDDKLSVDLALMDVYIFHPDRVLRYNKDDASDGSEVDTSEKKFSTAPLTKAFDAPKIGEHDFEELDLMIKRPNFWTYSGEFYLQATQNYYSDNWYQGLESNYSWLVKVTLQANYNNKQKVTWSNKLEMNLGFQTNKSDDVHKVKTSTDLLRYTGKVGLQATKNWDYTFQVVANTQFMRSFASNSNTVKSDFLSPLNVNASIGMTYNVSWFKNRLTGSIYLSPLAVNFKYVDRIALATNNGIEEGKHSIIDYGSTFTVEGTWKFNAYISLKTRLYGYTPYDRVELQWENTLTVKVSKIIAMTIYVYPRFDDSVTKDSDYGYFQLKEYTSLGLTYTL